MESSCLLTALSLSLMANQKGRTFNRLCRLIGIIGIALISLSSAGVMTIDDIQQDNDCLSIT